jgi:type VI secretion system protein ImpG
MDEKLRYYEEELNYLIESGREFARHHPDRAEHLALSDPRYRDPHVQRLMESFAFLTGRVRQRLDDDFPELTHALLGLVWPHYLQPIPPIALLQFEPAGLQEKQTVERGFLVDSKVAADDVSCRFQTTYDIDIYPFSLDDATFLVDESGRPLFRLRFKLSEGADPSDLAVDQLRLFVSGEGSTASELHRILRQDVESVTLRMDRDSMRRLPASAIRSVGFAEDEAVVPYPRISFPGYRLFTEYFVFPEKFRFVDLCGLGDIVLEAGQETFEVDILLKQRPPENLHPSSDTFRLYVTPIINVFPREGEPIHIDHLKTRYRVLGDYTHPTAFEVVSVDDVTAVRRSDGAKIPRKPFYSFEFGDDSDEIHKEDIYYQITHTVGTDGGWHTHLALISQEQDRLPEPETLSLSLTCTNGRLCQGVGPGSVRLAAERGVESVSFTNITVPTPPIYPPLGGGSEWRFISHMALNFLSVADAGALRKILELYNIGNDPANSRRIDSIRASVAKPVEALIDGTPIRGTEVTLTIDEEHFDNRGDLLLFIEVLNEFLSLHSSINSYVRLVVRYEPSGEEYRCPMAHGRKPPL